MPTTAVQDDTVLELLAALETDEEEVAIEVDEAAEPLPGGPGSVEDSKCPTVGFTTN